MNQNPMFSSHILHELWYFSPRCVGPSLSKPQSYSIPHLQEKQQKLPQIDAT